MNAEIHSHQGNAPGIAHPALATLLAGPPPAPEAIAEHLDTVETPLLEPGAASFFWHGPADRVELVRWINAGVDRVGFQRVPGTDLWHLHLAVADGGRFEYKLAVSHDGHEAWHLDPRNPHRARDPFGENSVCLTFGYQRPAWSQPQGAPAGRIERLEVPSTIFGETRVESLYLPAGHDPSHPHPLVVIHDGTDFMTYADLAVSLDNLIAAGDIPPIVAALIQTRDRMGEYPRGRRHARYVVEELLPTVSRGRSIAASPRNRVLLGASLGAVASLSTAFRHPGVFGGMVLKSGSFILDPEALEQRSHPVFHQVARLVRAMRRAPKPPRMRAFVSTGELEGLAGENRALAEFLRTRDVDVLFKSAWDGHHWHNWRDQLRDGLMWTLRDND
ncbi:MAG: alpha/beta hydrolase-fold protein [Paracoccaceae bacterium]|nr:alpha/beta hydrolase-fold protein [Paracoccaceae bacterium]